MGAVEVLVDFRYLQVVPGLMEAATSIIRVAQYKMHVKGRAAGKTARILAEKLAAKVRDGVEVRVLLYKSGSGTRVGKVNADVAEWLKERGVEVRYLPSGRTIHAKLVLVDDQVAVVGSHNWAVNSMKGNFEVSVVVRDGEVVSDLAARFDALWREARPF